MALATIDIEGLSSLIGRLSNAVPCLHSARLELAGGAGRTGVPWAGLNHILDTASWVEDELPGLRRRLDMAYAADAAHPAAMRGGTVSITDPTMTAREAEAVGRQLAADLMSIEETGEEGAMQLRDVLARVEQHVEDPDAMSAFYAALGPKRVEDLPTYLTRIAPELDLRSEWSGRAARDLDVLGRAFTTALHDSDPPTGLDEIVTAFSTPTKDHHVAWSRLALMQYGALPTEHLVAFTRANALDAFVDNWEADFNGSTPAAVPGALGLPADRLELAFTALASNPEAARRAISAGPGTAAMVQRVYDYYGRSGVRIDEAFGAALAAGAGVYDEDPQNHSSAAAQFAFDAITATAQLPGAMLFAREHYAAIAAAWVPELLAGATTGVSRAKVSSMDRPYNWEDIPGVRPRFYLTLDDTRNFLATFGHTDELVEPFHNAVGATFASLMTEAIRQDAGTGDSSTMEAVVGRFGDLAGVVYVAHHDLRSAMDERIVDFRQGATSTGELLFVPVGFAGKAADLAWGMALWAAGVVVDAKAEDPTLLRFGTVA